MGERGGDDVILEVLGDVVEHCSEVRGEGAVSDDGLLGMKVACGDDKFHGFSDLLSGSDGPNSYA